MKSLSILGSTGSIGTQTIDVVRKMPEMFNVRYLSAYSNTSLIIEQAKILNPKSIFDQNDVKSFFSAETDVDYAKKQVEKYETPGGFNPFLNLLTSIYES